MNCKFLHLEEKMVELLETVDTMHSSMDSMTQTIHTMNSSMQTMNETIFAFNSTSSPGNKNIFSKIYIFASGKEPAKLNMTEVMIEWNITQAVSSFRRGTPEQDLMMEALKAAIETEHRVEQTFRAHRHRTKFVRSTPESERIGHNFRMARTLQEAVHNGKIICEAMIDKKNSFQLLETCRPLGTVLKI